MRTRKHFGTAAVVLCVCALLVLGAFVFPAALKAPPENRGIETVTSYPELLTELAASDDSPNINAISKEQAVEIAKEAISYEEEKIREHPIEGKMYKLISEAVAAAKYLESTDPAGDPSWTVIMSHTIEGRYGPPSYAAIVINALTGEILALRGGVDLSGVSIEDLDELDGEEFWKRITIPTPPEPES